MNNKLYDEHDVHSSVPNCTIVFFKQQLSLLLCR